MVSSVDYSAQIEQMQAACKANPDNPYYLSALGSLYLKRNEGDDRIKALDALNTVITTKNESALTNRAKGLAFSRRGQYYRIQKVYELAYNDLTNAKVDAFYKELSDSEKKLIQTELSLVENELYPESTNKPTISWGACTGDAGKGMSSLASHQHGKYTQASHIPVVDSFYQMLNFLDGELDSPSASVNSSQNEKYWNGFAFCRKGIELLIDNEDDEDAKIYLEKAAKSFRSLKATTSHVPSAIHFYLSTIYFIQQKFGEALAEIQLAIEKNPDEVAYLKTRVLVYKVRAQGEDSDYNYLNEISQDEKKIAELAPYSSGYYRVLKEYNQVNHMIQFYDQVKTDRTTYADVLKELIELRRISLKLSQISSLTSVEIVNLFSQVEIRLEEEPAPYDSIPPSLYVSLSNKCGLDMVPKRGETLDPMDVLHLKAGGACSILCLENPERFKNEAFDHFTWVIDHQSPSSLYESSWSQAHFMKAALHHKFLQFEEELVHLKILHELFPTNKTIKMCIDNILETA